MSSTNHIITYGSEVNNLSKNYKIRDKERRTTIESLNEYMKKNTENEVKKIKEAYENLNKKIKELSNKSQFKTFESKLKTTEDDKKLQMEIKSFYDKEYNKIIKNPNFNESEKEKYIDDLNQFMEDSFGICMSNKKIIMLLNNFF